MDQTPPAPQTDARPTLCLTIGVTGHRLEKLGDADLTALNTAVSATLRQLQVAIEAVAAQSKAVFAKTAPQARLVTALADGADTIAAKAALAAGWRVDACLPFARWMYEEDFALGEARDQFTALLRAMSATFALPGTRAEETAAYEAVGRTILDQSDIIIALWDGDAARGRGGTSQVVAEAVARHIPVIHIDPHRPAVPMLLWSGLTDAEIEQPVIDTVPRARADGAIRLAVSALCLPPDNPIDRRMLHRLFHSRTRKRTPALPYPVLLAVAGVRRLTRADVRPECAETSATPFAQQLAAVADTGKYGHALINKLVARFGVADSSAAYFAQIFRSGFVANFSLAAIAVVLALTGPMLPTFKFWLVVLELLCVVLILINTHAGRRFGWHERWMDDRHLAEQLRSLAMTSLLGDLGLRASSDRDAAAIPGWVRWLSRATARELGLPHAVADRAYLTRVRDTALGLITDQIEYHRSNAARMHKLEARLHRAGEVLFGATILACLAWIIAKLAGAPMGAVGSIGANEIVTALTASLPAMGAALYGIRMQGDFAGIAERAQVTVTRLDKLLRVMADDPVDYSRLSARLGRLADIMLTDVAHWRTTYQARPLTLPG